MNTATFRRSRSGLAAWLLGPPVFIFLLNYVGVSQGEYVAYQLSKERQLEQVIPQLEDKVQVTSKLIHALLITGSGQDRAPAPVTTFFHTQAREHQIDIHSFSTSHAKPADSTLPGTLVLQVRGEASLPDFIGCLDDLQQSDTLFKTRLANLRITSLYPEPRYTGNFILNFHALPNRVPEISRHAGTIPRPSAGKGDSRGPG